MVVYSAAPIVRGGDTLYSPEPEYDRKHIPIRASLRFDTPVVKAYKCFEKSEASQRESVMVPDLAEELLDPTKHESEHITGRKRYARARWTIASYRMKPSPMQEMFLNNMFGACAQLIFKDDLETERDDFMLELGVDRLQPEFMAITPRRTGKTYTVAMFVVCMAFAVERLEQAIFSTGRRASKKLLDLIYSFICRVPGMKEWITVHNVETIELTNPKDPKDVRKISSYPSKVKISLLFSSLLLSSLSVRRCVVLRCHRSSLSKQTQTKHNYEVSM